MGCSGLGFKGPFAFFVRGICGCNLYWGFMRYMGACRGIEGVYRGIEGIVENQLEESMVDMETGMTQQFEIWGFQVGL